jgi:hypothetical protein
MACSTGEAVMRISRHLKLCERSMDTAQWGAYIIGKSLMERDRCMGVARSIKDAGMRKLYVGFARDHHREYLRHLRNIPVSA